jgi:hypothetical protein
MMSQVAHRVTRANTNDNAFPLYIRHIPANAQQLHFNGVLRDKWGISVTNVLDSLIAQMRELYDMSCAFDLLVDFAYDANYEQRRNLYSNYDALDGHLDTLVNSVDELDAFIADTMLTTQEERALFVLKQSTCVYQWGHAMTGAFLMNVYDANLDISSSEPASITEPVEGVKEEVATDDVRGMCVSRGILV